MVCSLTKTSRYINKFETFFSNKIKLNIVSARFARWLLSARCGGPPPLIFLSARDTHKNFVFCFQQKTASVLREQLPAC